MSSQNKFNDNPLIPLSFDEVKVEWIRYFRDIERKLEKAKSEWNIFETEAHSLFQTWYHSTFSKDLSELRELEEKVSQMKRTLMAIDAQVEVNGLTKREAFNKVQKAVCENRDPFPSDEEIALFKAKQIQKFQETFAHQLEREGHQDVDRDLLEKLRKEAIAEAMRRYGPPTNHREADLMNDWIEDVILSRYGEASKGDEKVREELLDEPYKEPIVERIYTDVDAGSRDFKTIYRQIVRLLHPDRGHEMNETEKELWAQAQTAHRSQDESALRAVLLRIEGGGRIDINKLQSIGAIRALLIQFHMEYDEINFIKSRVKKEPVYRFWASRKRPANRKKLEQQVSAGLRTSLHYARLDLNGLHAEMKYYERQFAKKR